MENSDILNNMLNKMRLADCMPKRDKERELEERLGRIEDGLARSDLNYAIRQLGGRLDVFNFNPSEKVESLPLYESALAVDDKSYLPRGFANRLEGLYGQILSSFEAYKKKRQGKRQLIS